ncbi:MAG: hypothetical protein AAFO84_00600 [Cyanobacteria bacterium J06598_1]
MNALPKTLNNRPTSTVIATLLITSGVILSAQSALAQSTPNGHLNYDAASGSVQLNNNTFNIQTGSLENDSNIPLPAHLPSHTQDRVSQPVNRDLLAPNTVELSTDIDYLSEALNEAATSEGKTSSYTVNEDTLQFNTQFNVERSPGDHSYAEGIEITVYDENGEAISGETTFVRGDGTRRGPDGETLPETGQIDVSYGAKDTVELSVLNIRGNGTDPQESGIYFSEDGEFVVEDLQNGGDRDFNDGIYTQVSSGQGEAQATVENETVSTRTQVRSTELTPETRIEEVVVEEIVENIVEADSVSVEERERGQVELPNSQPTTQAIGHATGVTHENGEQLVYNRYTGNSQIRAGSDGLGVTGQLKPLVNNPNVPPTLLSGNLTFNPFVGDNTAGLTAAVGINQFLNPTHRLATDALGNTIANPDADGAPLVEPAGLFNNRRLVGYVPATVDQAGAELVPNNGVFELPTDQAVVISAADSAAVGPGNAAYTDNVGGILIERATGDMSFVPQWTKEGYAQSSLSLGAGEAVRAIYALVPQQAGQNLSLGETYDVVSGPNGYEIAAGGFSIISADQQPENFAAETATVYAVEDTVAGNNAVTELFNGIPGLYAESVGGQRVPTLDVTIANEVDARVGNTLLSMEAVTPGQAAYARTTRAAGFYLGGSLAGGLGNQRDTVRQIDMEMDSVTSEFITQRTFNTFETPITERETIVRQRTETVEQNSTASFDINSAGELTNVSFVDGESEVVSVENTVVDRQRRLVRGEERLVRSETEESLEVMSSDMVESDRTTQDSSDSYANVSSLMGELTLGGVMNFGNTPWTDAANTVRAELFAQNTVVGLDDDGIETGWRAEVLFHPFGEVQRTAHQYDEAGNAVPIYQTRAAVDANGQNVFDVLTGDNGEQVEVLVNEFVTDEAGDRIAQTIGTGKAKGPGVYLRAQDSFSDDDGIVVAGGFQFSF